jgi:RNA polymerase sigma factor for flagellar operon FliA
MADLVYRGRARIAIMGAMNPIQQYAPLVMRVARQLSSRLPASVELDDMVQAGMIGLMDAATRYEADHGVLFETFATQRVRGAMLDELRTNDWVPRRVRKAQRDIDTAVRALQHRLGRTPREAEVAREIGATPAEYREMLAESHASHVQAFEESLDPIANAAAPDADPAELLQEKRFRSELAAAIGELPEREGRVMSLYYEHDLNYREIAAVLGVTESRVCQLHSQAVARLRSRMESPAR